jgi:hypothetical protein
MTNGCGCNGKVSTPSTGSVASTPQTGCGCSETSQTQVLVSGAPVIKQGCCSSSQNSCCNTGVKQTVGCTTVLAVGENVRVGAGVVVPVSKQTPGTSKIYYKHSLKILNSFVIPLFNGTINVAVEQSAGIAAGTVLFNNLVGWLRVTNFDASKNTIDIQNFLQPRASDLNPSITYNEVGKPVDACTEFAVGTPDYDAGSAGSSQNCLLTDFFSPAVDLSGNTTVTIELSNVDSILVGSRLSIGSYEYVIKTVVSSTVVEIYNAGAGAPAGTKVVGGKDCTDSCITVVSVLAADNPCEKTAVQEGILLVCDGQDIKPFTSTADNSVPVWDAVEGKWKPQILTVDTTICTALTSDFTIDNVGTDFPATVGDTSGFELGGVNSLLKMEGNLFKITAIVDATHLRLNPLFTPAGIVTYDTGTTICVAPCCDCPNFSRNVYLPIAMTAPNPQGVSALGTYVIAGAGAAGDIELTNPSDCQRAAVVLYVRFGAALRLPTLGIWKMKLVVDDGTGAVTYYEQVVDTLSGNAPSWYNDWERTIEFRPSLISSGYLDPSQTVNFNVSFKIETTDAVASGAEVSNAGIVVTGIISAEGI